ncbi:hypothetical protein AKJ59_00625 [candidate division MSBL1 archaeon SCGC-AAA385M02]|uniref:Uncharacterized protein n=1 Tax=candidate division MSBL1 archaeon SCGC-AAA385M02 TaxID=1698287 RepID=A0A133VQI2_9EURY|nr:hypothetical protein AKJ59_00625 [candidate division MSBL1 archaeon SCGC-AAA385M02]
MVEKLGQYFVLVNPDKKEYVRPWDIGGAGKLCEWCGNPQSRMIAFLLAHGPDDGVAGSNSRYKKQKETGEKQPHPKWGRWAGDHVVLVGDYDNSGLYQKAEEEYTNVSELVLKEYNKFMGYDLRDEKVGTLRPDMIVRA